MAVPTSIQIDPRQSTSILYIYIAVKKRYISIVFISIYIRIYITRCSPRATNFLPQSHQVKSYTRWGPQSSDGVQLVKKKVVEFDWVYGRYNELVISWGLIHGL